MARLPRTYHVRAIYPLTPLQDRLLFHHLLDAERDGYVLSALLAFASRKSLDAAIELLQSTPPHMETSLS
jgi:hypothetical protein